MARLRKLRPSPSGAGAEGVFEGGEGGGGFAEGGAEGDVAGHEHAGLIVDLGEVDAEVGLDRHGHEPAGEGHDAADAEWPREELEAARGAGAVGGLEQREGFEDGGADAGDRGAASERLEAPVLELE